EKQLFNIVHNIHKQEVQHAEIEPFLPQIYEELKDLSKEELIKRFASVEFNRFLTYYRNAPDLNLQSKGARKASPASGFSDGNDRQRYFVNIGLLDGVTKKEFIKLMTRDLGVPSHAIGEIDLRKAFMHFEVDPSFATLVREGLEEFSINGRSVRVDDATPRGGGKGGKFEKRGGEKWEKKGKRGKW
ncbi:MAG TPA: DbpA RNA binding domain-containing protein, partial [Saprospiraceae bacterium]|nr:DbpA RNA binding domain-containing protein [Saprospiraceae bacterium]